MFFDILETTTIYTGLKDVLKGGTAEVLKKLGEDGAAAKVNEERLSKTGKAGTFSNGRGKSRISSQSSGINGGIVGSRHTRVADTIVLYTPPGVKTSYTVTHSGKETGMIGDVLGAKSMLDLGARGTEIMQKIGIEIGQLVTSAIPGVGDLKGALQKVTGRAFNNNLEMVFEGVPMREFQYNFEFAPRNRGELDSVRKIISLFKFHMHPELGLTNDFVVPSQFQLTYMYLDKQNMYIPRISKCVLTKMDL